MQGDRCTFAHSDRDMRLQPDLKKTKLCQLWTIGKCVNPDCSFAHGITELRSPDASFKTSLCFQWQKGFCAAGDSCRYAHGAEDLRTLKAESTTASEACSPMSSPQAPPQYMITAMTNEVLDTPDSAHSMSTNKTTSSSNKSCMADPTLSSMNTVLLQPRQLFFPVSLPSGPHMLPDGTIIYPIMTHQTSPTLLQSASVTPLAHTAYPTYPCPPPMAPPAPAQKVHMFNIAAPQLMKHESVSCYGTLGSPASTIRPSHAIYEQGSTGASSPANYCATEMSPSLKLQHRQSALNSTCSDFPSPKSTSSSNKEAHCDSWQQAGAAVRSLTNMTQRSPSFGIVSESDLSDCGSQTTHNSYPSRLEFSTPTSPSAQTQQQPQHHTTVSAHETRPIACRRKIANKGLTTPANATYNRSLETAITVSSSVDRVQDPLPATKMASRSGAGATKPSYLDLIMKLNASGTFNKQSLTPAHGSAVQYED